MGLLDRAINQRSYTASNGERSLADLLGLTDATQGEIHESTYYTCLDIISKKVAICNLQIKKQVSNGGEIVDTKHYLNDLLKLRPNANMNIYTLIKTVVTMYKHRGISGIYIDRNINGEVLGLYPAEIVQLIIDDVGLIKSTKNNKVLVDFKCGNSLGSCFEKDIILLKDFTLDGMHTRAVKDLLKTTISTNMKSQNYLNTIFDNGLTNKLVVQCVSDIEDESQINLIQNKFNRLYKANGRVFTVPVGFNVTPLNLNLSDAQFEQLKRMSMQQIASAMGVKMSMLGDYKDTNNNSLEQQNIEFLQDTLQPIITQLEQELDWKLLSKDDRARGYKIRFNVSVLLRTDSKTQAEILTMYIKAGAKSINDVKKILGDELIEGGDTVFMPSGQVTLDALIKGQTTYINKPSEGGENNGEGIQESDRTEGD